jgi:hypothetical protein
LHCKELQDNALDLDRVSGDLFRWRCFAWFLREPLISELISKAGCWQRRWRVPADDPALRKALCVGALSSGWLHEVQPSDLARLENDL